MANKSYCEDLTEGKFSFPIIHAINSHPNDGQVIRILFLSIAYEKKFRKYVSLMIFIRYPTAKN